MIVTSSTIWHPIPVTLEAALGGGELGRVLLLSVQLNGGAEEEAKRKHCPARISGPSQLRSRSLHLGFLTLQAMPQLPRDVSLFS